LLHLFFQYYSDLDDHAMNKPIYLLTVCLLCFFACKKDKDALTGTGNYPQPIQLNSYPLSIGNSWKYYSESHFTDSIGNTAMYSYYDCIWESLSDTLINGITCTKISQLDSNYTGSTHLGHTYYTNKPDGFYGVAIENQGGLFYLRTTEQDKLFASSFFGSFDDKFLTTDTAFVPDTSLRFLKFPSTLNDIWLSYEYNYPTPDIFKRKWIGYSTINTLAGTFDCIKMHLFWDYDYNNQPDSGRAQIFQYFSIKGLVQEEWTDVLTFADGKSYTFNRVVKLVQVNF